ncbi:MAG: ABC transporter substrate-binding protein [Caldilineaceae bacterium]
MPSAVAQEPIKIGIIAPFTGPLAASGESTWRGMLLAADEINANGGVLGRPIEILMRNVGKIPPPANRRRPIWPTPAPWPFLAAFTIR